MRMMLPGPCPKCGAISGECGPRGPHYELRCDNDHHVKYVPKRALGLPVRSTSSCDLRPKDRTVVLERFGWACACCGKRAMDGVELHMGHLISKADGERLGIGSDIIDHTYNRAPMCEECNGGLGRSTVGLQLMAQCIRVHMLADDAY